MISVNPLSEQLVDFEDKFYLQLERDVKKSHLEIAARKWCEKMTTFFSSIFYLWKVMDKM